MADPRTALAPAPHGRARGADGVQPGGPAPRRHGGGLVARATSCLPDGRAREQGCRAGPETAERCTPDDLPSASRGLLLDVVAAGTPILLVHVLVDNVSVFTLLRRALRRRGFGQVPTSTTAPSPRTSAARPPGWPTCRAHVRGQRPRGCTWSVGRSLARRGGGALRRAADGGRRDLDQLIVAKRSVRIDHPDLAARNVPAARRGAHDAADRRGGPSTRSPPPPAHLDADGTTLRAGVAPTGEGTTLPATTAGPAGERSSSTTA